MKTTFKILTAAGALLLGACSSAPPAKTKEEIQTEQIQAQPPADSAQQIMRRAALAFSNAPELSAEQKMRLSEIYSQVYLKSMKIRREIGQAKSLMFATLARVDYDSTEIASLKRRIVKLDQDRLDLMFVALAQVQEVVGKGMDKEKIYKYFEKNEIPQYMRDYREE